MALPLLIFAGLSALAKGYSGYSKNKSLRDEGALIAEQGAIQYTEALRDASIVRHEGQIFLQKQSLQYIGSGVQLSGSALITLRQTELYANEYADSIERRGLAVRDLSNKKRDIMQKEGTSSLLSGLFGGAGDIISVFSGEA